MTTEINRDSGSHCTTTVYNLLPEILTEIFQNLPVKDLGAVACTCKLWNQILFDKRLWRGTEAKIHVKRSGNQLLYQTLHRRGIQSVQVLSLKGSLRELTNSLRNIRSLKISGCYNVTDGTLSSGFSMRLENLRVLNLSLCKQISDFSIGRIAMTAVNLESLDLGGCCQITNRGLLMLSWGLRRLSYLNLRSCYLITDDGIRFLSGDISPSDLEDRHMNDFLLKFGLVESPQVVHGAAEVLRDQSAAQLLSTSTMDGRFQLVKKARLDSDNSYMYVAAQCAICKQNVPLYSDNQREPYRAQKRSRRSHTLPFSGLGAAGMAGIMEVRNVRESSSGGGSSSGISRSGSGSSKVIVNQQTGFCVEKINRSTVFGNKMLEELILQDCQKLSDNCLLHLAGLPKLRAINLSFCVHITDSGLRNLSSCSSLCEINLRACENVTDSGLANLAHDISSRVTHLDISFCDKVRNLSLNYISHFSRLRCLSMSACEITDEGLIRVVSSLERLETLNIGQCDSITDASLMAIGEKCRDLKYIDLYGCSKITPAGLTYIMKLPSLKHMNLGLWSIR